MMYVDLILNLTLLVALSIISGFIENHWTRHSRVGPLLQGILFGGAAVVGMLRPLNLGPGLIFDGRSVMLSLCALFYGPWAGFMATAMTILCRTVLGGMGTFTGILVILSSLAVGLWAHYRWKPGVAPPSVGQLYFLGAAVHLAMLALMFTLPGNAGLAVTMRIGLPVMVLYPFATILVGKILSDQVSASRSQTDLQRTKQNLSITLQSIGDAVLSTDLRGRIVFMNPVAEALTGWPQGEAFGKLLGEVFQVINEGTREKAEDPVSRVLAEGQVVGLANHTLLVARDGTERSITDSAAPIRDESGEITGVVLVFRGQGGQHRVQRLMQARLALLEYSASHSLEELLGKALDEATVLAGSSIGFYHFVEPDQRTLSLQQWSTRTLRELCRAEGRGMHYGIDQAGVWVDCVHQRKPVIHNDYASLPHRKGMPEGHAEVIRELVVPIMRQDKVVAILGVGNKASDYTEEDVEAVSYLADVTWHIVERKRTEVEQQKSEMLFRNLFEHHAAVKLIVDPRTGSIIDANEAAESYYGWPREQLRLMRVQDINTLSPQEVEQELEKARTQNRVYFEFRHRRADGSIRDVDVFSSKIEVGGRELLHSIVHDTTERKLIQEALKESEERFSVFMDHLPAGVFIKDHEGRVLFANRYMKELFGWEQFLGKTTRELLPPEVAEQMMADDWRVLNQGPMVIQERVADTLGRQHLFDTYKFPILSKGDSAFLGGIAVDVTERRQAEQALRESEEAHRTLVAGLPDIVMRFDRDGRHLFVSENVEDVVDLQAARFIGKTHRELGFPEEQCRFWEDAIRKAFDSGTTHETEFSFEGKRGPVIFNWRLLPERDDRGRVCTVLSLCRDITEHRQAERDYQTLFREMMDGFALHEIICDPNGQPTDYRFLAVNPAFEGLTGLKADDLIGKTVLEVLPAVERHWIEIYGRVALTGEPAFFENYASELDRHYEVKAFRPAPNQFACIFTDVSERKRAAREREKLEAQLHQAQKLEAIGTLAGGIAHDFNNILGAVLGYSEMALDDIPQDTTAHQDLEQVLKAAYRAKDLVRQILAFSRQGETPARQSIEVSPILKEALKLLRSTLPTTIELRQQLPAHSLIINGDPTQLHQIVVNLCTNAAHAMRERGGLLEVRLEEVTLDAVSGKCDEELRPGSYVRLTIMDSGHGMEEAVLERIFDPYFTTKGVGEGTGLGLAVVRGIVKRHEGAIRVRSKPGSGTVFEILFPRIEEGGEHTGDDFQPFAGGAERILLVDDEEALAMLGERMLVRLGYQVTVKTSSLEAIGLFRAQPDAFDLVVTDHTMPHMTGMDMAREMLRIRPDIPIVLCTGFNEKASAEAIRETGIRELLMKPLDRGKLAKVVRDVLDDKEG